MEQLTTKSGQAIRPMQGTVVNADSLVNERIIIMDYRAVPNGKDSEYYLRIQVLHVTTNAKGEKVPSLEVFKNGSFEIKDFFRCVDEGTEELRQDTFLRRDGKSFYFECHHVSNKDACEAMIEQFNIKL